MKAPPLIVLLALAACTAHPGRIHEAIPRAETVVIGQAQERVDSVTQWYRDAVLAGKRVWQFDAQVSLISVTVRRGGAFARLGHDHVVASRQIEGWVAPDHGRADLRFRLDQMIVDDPDLRKQAGLMTTPSADAIEGTRKNMLGKVLDAERFPVVTIGAESLTAMAGSAPGLTHGPAPRAVRLRIVLHGVERLIEVPCTIEHQADSLTASGSFTLLQTEFGITPMSVLGGALVVEDKMELHFRLIAGARRQNEAAPSATQSASGQAR